VGYVVQMNGIPIAVTGTTVTQVEPMPAGSIYCGEARRLLDELADAIHELIQVHEPQFKAIIQGDLDCTRFDLWSLTRIRPSMPQNMPTLVIWRSTVAQL
jgi:hypothetical protein